MYSNRSARGDRPEQKQKLNLHLLYVYNIIWPANASVYDIIIYGAIRLNGYAHFPSVFMIWKNKKTIFIVLQFEVFIQFSHLVLQLPFFSTRFPAVCYCIIPVCQTSHRVPFFRRVYPSDPIGLPSSSGRLLYLFTSHYQAVFDTIYYPLFRCPQTSPNHSDYYLTCM